MGRELVQRVLSLRELGASGRVLVMTAGPYETPCPMSLSCLPVFVEKPGPDGYPPPDGDQSRRRPSYLLRCTQAVTRRKGGGTQSRRRAPRSDIGKKKTPKHGGRPPTVKVCAGHGKVGAATRAARPCSAPTRRRCPSGSVSVRGLSSMALFLCLACRPLRLENFLTSSASAPRSATSHVLAGEAQAARRAGGGGVRWLQWAVSRATAGSVGSSIIACISSTRVLAGGTMHVSIRCLDSYGGRKARAFSDGETLKGFVAFPISHILFPTSHESRLHCCVRRLFDKN